jgi:hypothetical protein
MSEHSFSVGDFNVNDELELYFIKDYFDKSNNEHRILMDDKGREYDTFLSQDTKYIAPKKKQKILYLVKKILEDGYPLCKEKIKQLQFDINEFQINDAISLSFIKDEVNIEGKNIRFLEDDKKRTYKHPFQSDTVFPKPDKGQKIDYFVRRVVPGGKPIVWEGRPNEEQLFNFGEYREGEIIDLTFVKEYEKDNRYGNPLRHRVVRDTSRNKYIDTLLELYQVGYKYKQPDEGQSIKYKVVGIRENNAPYLKELDVVNPYFVFLDELTTFTKKIYKLDKNSTISIEIFEKYSSKDTNWVLPFLKKIYQTARLFIESNNFEDCKSASLSGLEVLESIDRSDILETYAHSKKGKTQAYLNINHNNFSNLIKACELLLLSDKGEVDRRVCKIINELIDNNEGFLSLHVFLKNIMKLITNSNLELLISHYSKDSSFYESSFTYQISETRKNLRRVLFNEDEYISLASLEGNPDLKHLIFLEEFEFDRLKHKGLDANSLLSKACVNRLKAYYYNKSEYIHNSISILEDGVEVSLRTQNYDERKFWFKNRDFELVFNYNFLVKRSDDTKEIIGFLKKMCKILASSGNFKSYVYKGLVDYYELIYMFESGTSIVHITNQCRKKYKKYNQPDKESLFAKETLLLELRDMFRIVGLVGNKNVKSKEFLLHKSIQEYNKGDHFHNQALSSLVLARNLLSDITNQDAILDKELSEVFLSGSLELTGNLLFPEDKDEDYEQDKEVLLDIGLEEGHVLEFKASYLLDLKSYCKKGNKFFNPNPAMKHSALKTIAGMLNSNDGGTLYIGVLELKDPFNKEAYRVNLDERMDPHVFSDSKVIVGVENELMEQGWSLDDLISSIHSAIREKIHADADHYVKIYNKNIGGKSILQVVIEKNALGFRGWWLDNKKGDKTLYVRQDNKTMSYKFNQGMDQLEVLWNKSHNA